MGIEPVATVRNLNPWKMTDGLFAVSERDKKLLYIFMTPVLVPLFAMIYSLPFLLVITFIVIPFGITLNPYLIVVSNIVIAACFALAIITVIRMWLCQKQATPEH